MLNLLADMLQNSNITDADVERERDTILREMEDVESIVEEVFNLNCLCFLISLYIRFCWIDFITQLIEITLLVKLSLDLSRTFKASPVMTW